MARSYLLSCCHTTHPFIHLCLCAGGWPADIHERDGCLSPPPGQLVPHCPGSIADKGRREAGRKAQAMRGHQYPGPCLFSMHTHMHMLQRGVAFQHPPAGAWLIPPTPPSSCQNPTFGFWHRFPCMGSDMRPPSMCKRFFYSPKHTEPNCSHAFLSCAHFVLLSRAPLLCPRIILMCMFFLKHLQCKTAAAPIHAMHAMPTLWQGPTSCQSTIAVGGRGGKMVPHKYGLQPEKQATYVVPRQFQATT